MNWDAITAIADILGVILVLISLVYLAAQIKHNTDAIQGQTSQAIMQTQQNELQWAGDISDIYTKAIEHPTELSSSESWAMTAWLVSAMAARQNEFFQYKQGLLAQEYWEETEKIIHLILSQPWFRNWWKTMGVNTFTDEFVALVDTYYDKEFVYVDYRVMLQQLRKGIRDD